MLSNMSRPVHCVTLHHRRLTLLTLIDAFHDSVDRLKPLDIETMRRLGTRVNLIPVIAKADTMTPADLATFKDRVSGGTPMIPFSQRSSGGMKSVAHSR